jgi:hypothetical protein
MADTVNTDELRQYANVNVGSRLAWSKLHAAADEIDRLRESEHWREEYERLLLKERAKVVVTQMEKGWWPDVIAGLRAALGNRRGER